MKNYILTTLLIILLGSCHYNIPEGDVMNGKANPDPDPKTFQDQLFLPDGFGPEGITSGRAYDFFVGSVASGAIYKGSFRTGEGAVLVPSPEGKRALGLAYDGRTDYLYVAGGNGEARVYDATNGEEKATINLNDLDIPNTFINDVVVTREAAYFTDSFQPHFYRVPLLKDGGLPNSMAVDTVPLTGDFEFTEGAFVFNANGIVATPSGNKLIIAHSTDGKLYSVDPRTGRAQHIDLGGNMLTNADGLVLEGKTLYAVQNADNQISAIQLNADYTAGEIKKVITDPDFKVPTTATKFGKSIYAVNARFDEVDPFGGDVPDILFDVIRVDK